MKRGAALAGVAVLFAALVFLFAERGTQMQIGCPRETPRMLTIGERAHVCAAVAATPEERTRGLSNRAGLAENEGMLFVFDDDGRHAFWMKEMRFAIDILWISRDGAIVDIARAVTPETYPSVFVPRGPARYVLELPAGYAAAHRIGLGDRVEL